MKKIVRLISVAAIAMALIIAFSGVASASSLAEYDRMEIGDQGFDWKSSSIINLLNTGNVKYNGIMIGSGVATDFNKNFIKSTGDTSKWNGLTDVLAASKIDAGGLKEGSMAKGTISAGVSVFVVDGSILSYEEKSTASGLFAFHKVIDYTSVITPP